MPRTDYPRGGHVASANSMLHRPWWRPSGAGCRPLLYLHGHDASALQSMQGGAMGFSSKVLCDECGYVAAGVDLNSLHAGAVDAHSWPSPEVMQRITDTYTDLVTSVGGVPGVTKIGIIGWSGGCADGTTWTLENPDLVAGSWYYNGLLDLDWAHGTAHATPFADVGVAPSAGWITEIDEQFGSAANYNGAAGDSYRIWNRWNEYAGLNVPTKFCQASDDPAIPHSMSETLVANVNVPHITLRQPSPTGGHSNLWTIPPYELADFFAKQALWN